MLFIQPASGEHMTQYVDVFEESALKTHYFNDANNQTLISFLKEALCHGELFEVRHQEICVGVMRIDEKGGFGRFGFLRLIGVHRAFRSRGFGAQMLHFFEGIAAKQDQSAFLVVADFNPRAKAFYEKNGYVQVGAIPDLYQKGVLEQLMMKRVR